MERERVRDMREGGRRSQTPTRCQGMTKLSTAAFSLEHVWLLTEYCAHENNEIQAQLSPQTNIFAA